MSLEFPGWEWDAGPWWDAWPRGTGGAFSALLSSPNPVWVRVGEGGGQNPCPYGGVFSRCLPGDLLLHFTSLVNGPWALSKHDWTSLQTSPGPFAALRIWLLSWPVADPGARLIDAHVASWAAHALPLHFFPTAAASRGCRQYYPSPLWKMSELVIDGPSALHVSQFWWEMLPWMTWQSRRQNQQQQQNKNNNSAYYLWVLAMCQALCWKLCTHDLIYPLQPPTRWGTTGNPIIQTRKLRLSHLPVVGRFTSKCLTPKHSATAVMRVMIKFINAWTLAKEDSTDLWGGCWGRCPLLAPLASLLFGDACEKICQRPPGRPKGSFCRLWLPPASGLSYLPLRSGSRHLSWSLFTNKGHASCSFFAIWGWL